MAEQDLDSVLNDEAEVEAVEDAQQDTGEEGSPPEPQQPDISALQQQLDELRKEASGLKYALTDERQKRQLMEQRLGRREEEPSIPDPLDDPKGYRDALEKRQDERLQARLLEERLNMSRAFAASQHADYQEMEQRFAEMAQRDPRLIEAVRNHPNPAEYAYQVAHQSASAKTPKELQLEEEKRINEQVEKRIREFLGNNIPSAVSDLRATTPTEVGDESLYDIMQR